MKLWSYIGINMRRRNKHKKGRWAGTILFVGLFTLGATIKWLYDDPPQPIIISPLGHSTHAIASTPAPSPLTVDTQVSSEKVDVVAVVDKIWALESTRGTAKSGHHVWCRERGQSNEYGYNVPDGSSTFCFSTHEEGTARVQRWVRENLERFDGNLAMTLCYYNKGKPNGIYLKDCTYYQRYLEVK
ncbi:MAG: hypothetical protein KCHDKBKB_00671 [Elusimicrobia bacterium]|nr:hypothetical protein [Elusimicrobiota bacterium]